MDELYDLAVIDPPWRFASNSKAKPGRNAIGHYPCMTDAELKAMEIPLKQDSVLFCWVTAPIQWRAVPIIESWGFKPVAELMWLKSRIATGFWARNRHEKVWICRRGKGIPRPLKLLPDGTPKLDVNGRPIRIAPFNDSVIDAPTREHSRKPEDLQERIEKVWPDHSKIEIFARRPRKGWAVWGNQTDKFEGVE